jgi:CheY-like chemotaxis protein
MVAISRDPVRKRLFHVEDSAGIRNRIGRELAHLTRIEIVGFSDRADDAITQIRRIKPDLVVLDLQLAHGSGIDVLRGLSPTPNRLRSSFLPTIPIPGFGSCRFRRALFTSSVNRYNSRSSSCFSKRWSIRLRQLLYKIGQTSDENNGRGPMVTAWRVN